MNKETAREALKALEDISGLVIYEGCGDEIGRRGCCGVASYKIHDKDCYIIKAISKLRKEVEE